MNRDRDDFITREELNCQEFQDVLKSVMAPNVSVSTAVTYARVEENVQQVLDFCIRKADFNGDGRFSFPEFNALLRMLRNENLAQHTAVVIFALFDLDGNQLIDKLEFKLVYSFYLGHIPLEEEFAAEWARLDVKREGKVTLMQYIGWLRTSKNPIFKQHAPPVFGEGELAGLNLEATRRPKKAQSAMEWILQTQSARRSKRRPVWNGNFTSKYRDDIVKTFSRPQSLPELQLYYSNRRGFETQMEKLASPPAKNRRPKHSLDAGLPTMLPERYAQGGTMRNRRGHVVPWMDEWQEPAGLPQSRIVPGSLSLRLPGPPPLSLLHGREAEDMEDEEEEEEVEHVTPAVLT